MNDNMDEQKSLLEKPAQRTKISTGVKVSLYVLLYGCAFQVAGLAEPQFVYAYIKDHSNVTNIQVKLNTSTDTAKSCLNTSKSSDDKIQGIASDWMWYNQIAEAGMALLVLMFAGPIADKIGRKPLLLWNIVITFISFAFKTVIVYTNMNLYFYVIACGVLGFSGTFYTFHLANLAILADSTSKGGGRSIALTVYQTLLGVGTVVSQIATGYLIQLVGFTYPFLITSGLMFTLLVFIYFSLDDRWRSVNVKTNLSINGTILQICAFCTKKTNINGKSKLFFLIFCVYCFCYVAMCGMYSLNTIYLLGSPFCWTSEHIGYYGATSDFVMFVTGSLALKCIHTFCVRLTDEIVASFCILTSVVYFVIFGISSNDWMIYIAAASGSLRVLPFSLLQACLSRMVKHDKHGLLFSNVYLLEAASKLGAATLFNNIYVQTFTIYNGLIFFVMACFPFVGFILMIWVICISSPRSLADLEEDNHAIQKT